MADRPEVEKLGYALAKQVPDMERGFVIQTSYGDLNVDAGDAQRFASLAQAMLSEKLARARGASHLKHAPGPWITVDGFGSNPRGTSIGQVGGHMVASCTGYFGRDVTIANARLIAASPDLLAAAIAMDSLFAGMDIDSQSNPIAPIVKNLRSAISAATGGSHG
ncbi:hypothetical protein [Burkholderia gladioli]|uniref:hypothetical protein n=1 Tax=Burkholderia gladioli TaxID=28095 RepID=UPI001FC8BCDA|nr:hypothetical protein [Burkholderia gladioli]